MNLKCPKCGHSWNYKGNNYRIDCSICRSKGILTIIKTGLPYKPSSKPSTKPSTKPSCKKSTAGISDDIMHGNIIEALEKADIDPLNNNGRISKDFIPLLLKDDKLKYAFSKYCYENKKQPLWVVKQAIIKFLEEEKAIWYYAENVEERGYIQ